MTTSSGPREEERYARACALIGLRPPELFTAARELFADTEWRVRRAAWEAVLRAEADTESRLAFLLSCLENEDDAGMRGAALEALIALGDSAVSHLLAALPSRAPRFQRYILDVLAQVRASASAEAALALVDSADENVAFAAAEVVGGAGSAADARQLLARMQAAEQTRRFSLLSAMVQIAKRTPFSLPVAEVARFLEDPILKVPTAELLSYTGDASAAPLLWNIAVNGRALDSVILSLDRLRQRGFVPATDRAGRVALVVERCREPAVEHSVRRAAFELLVAVAPANLAILLPRLAEQDGPWLIDRLCELEDFRLRELLPALINNAAGRSVAAAVYRRRPELQGESALLALLNLPGDHRGEAVAALAVAGSLRAAPHLIALCADADETLAGRASDALVSLAKRGVTGLEDALFKVLGGKPPAAFARLLPVLGLFCESERARALLCTAMRDSEPAVRAAAAASAEALTFHPDVERMLLRCLTDENDDVRTAAAEICGRAGLAGATHALLVLLDDASPWVASTALVALTQIGHWLEAAKAGELLGRGGIVAVAAAAALARPPLAAEQKALGDRYFASLIALLPALEEDAAGELLKSLARWPQEVAREILEPLSRHQAWSVRAAVVRYLEVKKPVWLTTLGRDWLQSENDDWVRTRLEELVGQ